MKNSIIYCFSGTGNSLFVAKEIAKETNANIEIINKSLLEKDISKDYNRLGIIFPVYHQGLPVIVTEFIKKLKDVKADYIFAVSTYGDKPTLALKYLKDILLNQGLMLNIGFAVRLPYNYLRPEKIGIGMYESFRIKIPNEQKCKEYYEEADKKIRKINDLINKKESGNLEISDQLIENIVDKFNLRNTLQKKQWLKIAGYKGELPDTFSEAIALMDSKLIVSNKCSSCGICSKVCPVDNITYKGNKPVWNHHCEQCMACLHWCRQGAISFGSGLGVVSQYHHPKITLEDILKKGN